MALSMLIKMMRDKVATNAHPNYHLIGISKSLQAMVRKSKDEKLCRELISFPTRFFLSIFVDKEEKNGWISGSIINNFWICSTGH